MTSMRMAPPLLLTLLLLSGCIPSAARKNAKIESGFDWDLTAGGAMAFGAPAEQPDYLDDDL